MKVLKFGGKSLDSKEKIQKICKYIKLRANKEQLIVVVSAFGNETNKLIECGNEFGNVSREFDALISTGEIKAASMVAMALDSIGVPAQSFSAAQVPIITMGSHGHGIITSIGKNNISACLNDGKVAVVAGFQGINENGEITTLHRGGSDTTAVALASVFDCEAEIYSDFDGIYAGDPRRLPYKKIPKLSIDDLCCYAESGAKVVSAEAAATAQANGVKMICKSSASPFKKGTIVQRNVKHPLRAISVCNELSEISLNYTALPFDCNKAIEYILQNVKFHSLSVTQHKLSVIVSKADEQEVEKTLAFLNNLIEDE